MDTQQIEQAEKHIKNAWMAGAFSATITFLFSMAGAYSDNIRYEYGVDTWSLFDVGLIAGLAYGIYRKNRFCALGLFLYFTLSKIAVAAASGQFTGGVLSLLFAYLFFQGTRATFQIRNNLIESGEIVKQKKGLGTYIGIFFGSILMLALGAIMVLGILSPELEAIPGKQIHKKYLKFVREQGIIDPSEQIQYWYSDGFADFKDGFYFYTNEKVVVYSQNWEEPAIIIPFSQIIDIEFEHNPSVVEDSAITLTLDDSTYVYFPVSSDNGGDKKYYDRLVQIWNSHSKEDAM